MCRTVVRSPESRMDSMREEDGGIFMEKEMDKMSYMYKTRGTCSTQIEVELDGNVVKYVKFTGGCHGNLQAIPKLVEGMTIEQVEEKIGGISCNGRPTSCGDQLAKACRAAYEAAQK